jgi:ACT domain
VTGTTGHVPSLWVVESRWYYVVRVWLPDRPGALGQVASRIGSVGGDVVGIEIMERGAGIAVDDLVVALPDQDLLGQLRVQISEVDGVEVEGIRPIDSARGDRDLSVLDLAAALAERDADVFEVLVERLCTELSADWAVVVHLDPPHILHSRGEAPSALWLAGFLEGARHLGESDPTPTGVVWARLPDNSAALVIGRQDYPFRWRERGEVEGLAAIADALVRVEAGSLRGGPRS